MKLLHPSEFKQYVNKIKTHMQRLLTNEIKPDYEQYHKYIRETFTKTFYDKLSEQQMLAIYLFNTHPSFNNHKEHHLALNGARTENRQYIWHNNRNYLAYRYAVIEICNLWCVDDYKLFHISHQCKNDKMFINCNPNYVIIENPTTHIGVNKNRITLCNTPNIDITKIILNQYNKLTQKCNKTGNIIESKHVFRSINELFVDREFSLHAPNGKNPSNNMTTIRIDGKTLSMSWNAFNKCIILLKTHSVITLHDLMHIWESSKHNLWFLHAKMYFSGVYGEWAKIGMCDPLFGAAGLHSDDPPDIPSIFSDEHEGVYDFIISRSLDIVHAHSDIVTPVLSHKSSSELMEEIAELFPKFNFSSHNNVFTLWRKEYIRRNEIKYTSHELGYTKIPRVNYLAKCPSAMDFLINHCINDVDFDAKHTEKIRITYCDGYGSTACFDTINEMYNEYYFGHRHGFGHYTLKYELVRLKRICERVHNIQNPTFTDVKTLWNAKALYS